MAAGSHPFPFRTRKLSPPAPMVLGERSPGRVGRRRFRRRSPRSAGGSFPFWTDGGREDGRYAGSMPTRDDRPQPPRRGGKPTSRGAAARPDRGRSPSSRGRSSPADGGRKGGKPTRSDRTGRTAVSATAPERDGPAAVRTSAGAARAAATANARTAAPTAAASTIAARAAARHQSHPPARPHRQRPQPKRQPRPHRERSTRAAAGAGPAHVGRGRPPGSRESGGRGRRHRRGHLALDGGQGTRPGA